MDRSGFKRIAPSGQRNREQNVMRTISIHPFLIAVILAVSITPTAEAGKKKSPESIAAKAVIKMDKMFSKNIKVGEKLYTKAEKQAGKMVKKGVDSRGPYYALGDTLMDKYEVLEDKTSAKLDKILAKAEQQVLKKGGGQSLINMLRDHRESISLQIDDEIQNAANDIEYDLDELFDELGI
jgi:hypothetical protein